MHMADALLNPVVATTMYAASAVVTGVSINKLRKEDLMENDFTKKRLPTMAVMSALVFAGQMINYTIPGTGSSGHICGGLLLSAILGPWAAFLSIIAVLLIQCLFFADGGLMALGANIWNMGFYSSIIGYFLIYKPIMQSKIKSSRVKVLLSSIVGCILMLQLGAFSVVLETKASGITEIPFGAFVGLMQPIHLLIGLGEGLITGAVLLFVNEARPELLKNSGATKEKSKMKFGSVILTLAIVVALVGGGLSLFASSNPDGLEWTLFGNSEAGYNENLSLDEEDYGNSSVVSEKAAEIQDTLSFLPDYAFKNDSENMAGTSVSGIVGSAIVAALAAGICAVGTIVRKKQKN